MNINKNELKLYAITDRSWLKDGQSLVEQVDDAIDGGATIIQFREKFLQGEELENLARELLLLCQKKDVKLIINDDVNLAKKINADGVHVGQSDMDVIEARKILGFNKIIGATAKTIEQAKEAQKAGADYLGSGAIFGSKTKTDAKPMDLKLFNDICDAVDIPVVAIGGINIGNVEALRDTKMDGIAVISGIFATENIKMEARKLRNFMDSRA